MFVRGDSFLSKKGVPITPFTQLWTDSVTGFFQPFNRNRNLLAVTPTFIFGSKLPRLPFENMFQTLHCWLLLILHLCNMLVGVASLTFRKQVLFWPIWPIWPTCQTRHGAGGYFSIACNEPFIWHRQVRREGAIEYSLVSRLNVAPFFRVWKRQKH